MFLVYPKIVGSSINSDMMSGVFFCGGEGRYLQIVEERPNQRHLCKPMAFGQFLEKVAHVWKIFKVVQETCFFWGWTFCFQNVGPGREKKKLNGKTMF